MGGSLLQKNLWLVSGEALSVVAVPSPCRRQGNPIEPRDSLPRRSLIADPFHAIDARTVAGRPQSSSFRYRWIFEFSAEAIPSVLNDGQLLLRGAG